MLALCTYFLNCGSKTLLTKSVIALYNISTYLIFRYIGLYIAKYSCNTKAEYSCFAKT